MLPRPVWPGACVSVRLPSLSHFISLSPAERSRSERDEGSASLLASWLLPSDLNHVTPPPSSSHQIQRAVMETWRVRLRLLAGAFGCITDRRTVQMHNESMLTGHNIISSQVLLLVDNGIWSFDLKRTKTQHNNCQSKKYHKPMQRMQRVKYCRSESSKSERRKRTV